MRGNSKFEDAKDEKKKPNYKGNSRRNRRGKPNSQGNRGKNADKIEKTNSYTSSDPKSSLNDIGWYMKNPELLQAAAMFPFPNKPGMNLNLAVPYATVEDYIKFKFPGVMQIAYDYTIGTSVDVTSPASICAKELYAQIRRAFSGSLDADAPDIFMYCMALDNIHAFIAWAKRLYRAITSYSSQNYYFPNSVYQAMLPLGQNLGLHKVEVAQVHKVQLWQTINTLVNMVNKFAVPANMDIYNRHRWMNENVYLDNPAMMGQAYVFCPNFFYCVHDDSSVGTELERVDMSDYFTVIPGNEDRFNIATAVWDMGNYLISQLSNWEDAYTINGYIQRAFEGVPFYYADLLGQDELLQPVYVEEVLNQIHNLTVAHNIRSGDITQDPNTNAVLQLFDVADGAYLAHSTILDCDSMIPTPAEITINTRLTALLDNNADDHSRVICGTELVTNLFITFDFDSQSVHESGWKEVPTYPINIDLAGAVNAEMARNIIMGSMVPMVQSMSWLSAWRKAPNLTFAWHFLLTGSIQQYSNAWNMRMDCTNIMVCDVEKLAPLHRVCVYSEFNCFNK